MSEVRVLIYGSCVSRDTFEFLPGGYRLLTYVARQSAISVDAPAAGVAEKLSVLKSPFQQRMVRGDIRGDLLDRVARLAPDVDLLLVDLIDERGGVISVGNGYVTKLAEMWSAGGAAATKGGCHIRFGTDEHFELWSSAIRRVVVRLDELDLFHRTVVLATSWASSMADGEPIPVPRWMLDPDTANGLYARYFTAIEELGVKTIRLPDELALSTAAHRWGPSPFHYTDEAYGHLAARIAEQAAHV